MAPERCEICDRKPGDTNDRCNEPTYDQVPFGPLEQCDLCQKWACPDCLHEADCCFEDEEDAGTPRGWRLVEENEHGCTYERIIADG